MAKPIQPRVPGEYRGLDRERERLARQALASIIEMTIADSSAKGDIYRPAALDNLLAIPAIAALLINQRKDKQPFSGSNRAERLVNSAFRGTQRATERTNRFLGTSNPRNTLELGVRVGTGLGIPMAKGSQIASLIGKAPKGAKVVAAGRKVAAVTPKPVKVAAKVATELVVPLRQTSLKIAAPVGAVITAAIDAAMDGAEVDPSTGERYDGSVRQALGFTDPNSPEAIEEEQLRELDQLMLETATEIGDHTEDDDIAEIDELMDADLQGAELAAVDHDEKLSGYQEAAVAVGGVVTAVAAAKYFKSFMRARRAAVVDPANIGQFTTPGRHTGKQFKSSELSIGDMAVTKAFDQTQPIRSTTAKFLGRDQAKDIGYRLDRISNTSNLAMAQHAYTTGELPGTNLRIGKLAQTTEAYAKELSLEEQLDVSDALNARSSLDDFKRTGVHSSMTVDRAGNPTSIQDLQMKVLSVRSNPKLAKYYDFLQNFYRRLAQFEMRRGLISQKAYQKLRKDHPHYVPHRRNLETDAPYSPRTQEYSANLPNRGTTRAVGAGEGIQASSGIGNPFTSAYDDLADVIRQAEHNDIRAEILTKLHRTTATDREGRKLVERVGPKLKNDDVHTVYVNGKQQHYIVRNPELRKALHFTPRVAVPVLEEMRQFAQNFTTGPPASFINLFNIAATPVFETGVAALLKNKGTRIGLGNHLLIGGYDGALGYIGDAITGQVARIARDNLIRDVSPLKTLLGNNNLGKLTTILENAYENSTKARMDALGISSKVMYGSPDPSTLMAGVDRVSPKFARATSQALLEDTREAYKKGEIGLVRMAVGRMQAAGVTINSNAFVRAYALLSEAMHNGSRYTALAANRADDGKLLGDVNKLISDMRRLTADTSKHGSSNKIGVPVNISMYGQITMQTMFEVGRRFRADPANILFNTAMQSTLLGAILYTSLANDPEALERHRAKTPTQKATSITVAGGAEIRLDPLQRWVMGMSLPVMDNLSGLNQGEFDPNFLAAMLGLIDGTAPEFGEEFQADWDIRMAKAVEDNMPVVGYNFHTGSVNLQSIPAANIALGMAGADPGMTRITGEVAPVREQDITGLDIEGRRRPDSIATAWWEGMTTAIFSSFGRSVLGIADDAYRAANHPDGSARAALDIAAQSWKDKLVPQAGLLRPLFGEYESVRSIGDINFELVKSREVGIERAVNVLNKDYRSNTLTAVGRTAMELPQTDRVRPELEGTEVLFIADIAAGLAGDLNHNKQILSAITQQIDEERAQYLKPIEERNKYINGRNEDRKYQKMMMLRAIREQEEVISARIGRPFTFDDFDPEEHLIPLVPEPQE